MAMVPLLDMLNHRRPPQTEWRYDQAARVFLLTARQAVSAGEQLFDSYGAKCNSRFLLNYGFTSAHNRGMAGGWMGTCRAAWSRGVHMPACLHTV